MNMPLTSQVINHIGPYGFYAVTKQLTKKYPRVLMYHRFSNTKKHGFTSKAHFERQIEYISKHYHTMTVSQLIELKYFQNKKIPNNTIAITVDDGHLDFYHIAFPILKKYNVTATLYITSGFVDKRLWLWPDKISWILDQVTEIPEQTYIGNLMLPPGKMDKSRRTKLWHKIIDYMLNVSNDHKEELIFELYRKLNITIPNLPPYEYMALNWNQVCEIHSEDIEIGGHTMSHPSLIHIDKKKAWEEISGCMFDIKKNLGKFPVTFCYPNGSPREINRELKSFVHKSGYIGAVVAFADTVNICDRFAIRRHACGNSMFQFHKAVSGTELLGIKLRKALQQNR